MFLCRHLLRQVCILKPIRSIIHYRNYALPFRTFNLRGNATSAPSPFMSLLPTPDNSTSSSPLYSPAGSLADVHDDLDLQKYVTLRDEDIRAIDDLQERVLARLLIQAVQRDDKKCIEMLCQDILELEDSRGMERDRLLQRLLLQTDFQVLPSKTVLAIFRHFTLDGTLQPFSDSQILDLTYQVVWHLPANSSSEKIRTLLYSTILARVEALKRVPGGVASVTHALPDIVSASFELLYKLLILKSETMALGLFQLLVERLYIPPEAVHQAPTYTKDFGHIVSVTLARACLYWDRRVLAHRLLLGLLPSESELVSILNSRTSANLEPAPVAGVIPQPFLDSHIIDLITETLYATLRSSSRPELRLCVEIICRIHPISPVQNGIIRLAYAAATELKFGVPARRLYSFTRDPAVFDEHQYPAPQGAAALSLMQFLTGQMGNTQLARTLAAEVADNSIFLPAHCRAEFIAITAAHGFSLSARTLWERYSSGKDRQVVVGSSRLMLRMVSLFTRISRGTETVLEQRATASPEGGFLDDPDLQERSRDTAAFAENVLAEYIKCHEPLEKAQHQHLTSLARAYFIIGRFTEGFAVFRLLLRRRELPDVHDINVALTALAEHQPRSAAAIIDRMIEKGLQPDSTTYGTVIHHALLMGDMELVGNLTARSRELGSTQLNPKGLNSLIRASVSPDLDVPAGSRTASLKHTLAVLESMPRKGALASPQVGKYMVYAALRENEPDIAFKFWRMLLKLSAEWEDREQIFIRRLLRRRLRQATQLSKGREDAIVELTTRPPYHGMK